MPEAEVIPKELVEKQLQEKEENFKQTIQQTVQQEVEKAELLKVNEAKRYRATNRFNDWKNADQKPGADVPFSMMRRMAVVYPIARACINRRIRQITQLEWDIHPTDETQEKKFENQIEFAKEFFKKPMGHKTRFRELLTMAVDDVLTLDAICFEIGKTRGGDFLNLIPVDPTTIILRVTDTGGTPEPPVAAYEQWIAGQKVANFTTDDMIYESMNNRSDSPYGRSPLESLIIQVESAIRGALYNLAYMRESNVPEGFLTLPEEVATDKEQVEQWQEWFDALMAGNYRMTRRLKILPGGSEYIAAKKPEDMSFERFEMWLLQQTCAVFDVPPQDIGITYQVNKATSESQSDLSRERGLLPLSNFLKEIFDDIIHDWLELPELEFQWANINPVDRKEEADIAAIEIGMGARSVDEYRQDQGLDPIGLGHYIKTSSGPLLVSDILSGNVNNDKKQNQQEDNNDMEDEDIEREEQKELKRWRKAIYKDLQLNRSLRTKFPSKFIHPETHKVVSEHLEHVHSREQAKILFDQFLDPEIRASMQLLKSAQKLRRIENADIVAE